MANLSLRHINKIYDNKVQAVFDFNLEIQDKEFIVLVGPSGCGKSTTLRMIAGLEDITNGELYIDDKLVNDVAPKNREIAMVFQSYALYPFMTVYENMAFGLQIRKTDKDEIDRRVRAAAKALEIEQYLDRKPKALSGGQRQRIGIARAIILKPDIVICDEPVSALDVSIQAKIINLLKQLQEELNISYIFISHDLGVVKHIADRILVMYLGHVVEEGTSEDIFNHPSHPYTRTLLNAIPTIGVEMNESSLIDGDLPSPSKPPKGCVFHTRCPFAKEECALKQPEVKDLGNGHQYACILNAENESE